MSALALRRTLHRPTQEFELVLLQDLLPASKKIGAAEQENEPGQNKIKKSFCLNL
jgi:hypothetical protein